MNAAKLAQMNAMHMDRKTYDEPSPQMGSLPPPPTTLAHQRYLKQMQRQYTDNMSKPDIARDADEPLDLGKERPRSAVVGADGEGDRHEADKEGEYYGKEYEEGRAASADRDLDRHESEYAEEERAHARAAASWAASRLTTLCWRFQTVLECYVLWPLAGRFVLRLM